MQKTLKMPFFKTINQRVIFYNDDEKIRREKAKT